MEQTEQYVLVLYTFFIIKYYYYYFQLNKIYKRVEVYKRYAFCR